MAPKPDFREDVPDGAIMCYSEAAASSDDGSGDGGGKKFEEDLASNLLLRQRSRGETSVSSASAKELGCASELAPKKEGRVPMAAQSALASTPSKHNEALEENHHPSNVLYSAPFFALLAYGQKEFALVFPFFLAPYAATETYVHAGYEYNDDETHFDNSAWTWATDYALAVLMTILAVRCLTARARNSSGLAVGRAASRPLRIKSAVLLFAYAISVLAGGYAHQTYHTPEAMNAPSFRLLWTLCVGSVCAAGGIMGSIGTEVCRSFHRRSSSDDGRAGRKPGEVMFDIPVVPDALWLGWAIYVTAICVRGDISYHRPACDIFIAGTTQFVPTAYCVSLLWVRTWKKDGEDDGDRNARSRGLSSHVEQPYRIAYYLGFIDNSILLPSYPLLVQYTNLSLGTVNALLHAWLTLSWSMQAIGLRHLCLAVDRAAAEEEEEPEG